MQPEAVFLDRSDDELAVVDPLAMNLLVAKGIPSLKHLTFSDTNARPTRHPVSLLFLPDNIVPATIVRNNHRPLQL